MDEKFKEICSCDALLTRNTLKKIGYSLLATSVLTIITITVHHFMPYKLWSFDIAAWAGTYPLRTPLIADIVVLHVSAWVAYGGTASYRSEERIVPTIVINKPKSLVGLFSMLVQVVAVASILLTFYLAPLAMYMEFYAFLK